MKFNIYIGGNKSTFIEVALSLQYSLKEIGHEVIGIQVYPEILNKCEGTIVIIGKPIYPGLDSKSYNICFLMEQWKNKNRYNFDGYNRILNIYKDNDNFTTYNSNISYYCPLGWSSIYEEKIYEDENIIIPDKIDFLFIGSPTERRLEIIRNWKDMYSPKRAFGLYRDELIKKAKINIMLKAYEEWNFSPLHYLLIANKKKLVMIDGYNKETSFKEGKHFLVFKNRNDCLPWLKDEEACKQFAEEAYDDLKKNYNFTDYLREAMRNI